MEPDVGVFMVYLDMFFELDTCRVASYNSPIPFTAIYNFANIKEIENFDEFLYIIRLLDNTVIQHREKQNDNANKNNSGKS